MNAGQQQPRQHEAVPELQALATKAAHGDTAALGQFLREIHPFVLRYCRGRLGASNPVNSAEDVAQDVLIAVCDALPRLSPTNSSIMAFVYGIARFKVVDAFRAAGRGRSEPRADMPDTPTSDPNVDYALDSTALRRAGLNSQQIAAVQGMVLGYSAQEQAELTGRSPAALRKDRQRALARLRQSFDLTQGECDALDAIRFAGSHDAAQALEVRLDELDQLLGSARRKIFATLRGGDSSGTDLDAVAQNSGHLVDAIKSLSMQDLAIMKLVVDGMSNEETAGKLDVTPKTVEKALTRIYREFKVNSRGELSASLQTTLMGRRPQIELFAEQDAKLQTALKQLPDKQREILTLRIALGFSAQQTAQMVGTTIGAVRVTQHRALAKLRPLLDLEVHDGQSEPATTDE